jgi:hypothetical protein
MARRRGATWWRWAVLAAGLLPSGCAHRPAPPRPVVPLAAPFVAPGDATGTYDLQTTLRRSPAAAPSRSRRPSRPAPEPAAQLRLQFQPLAAPDPTAQSGTQLSALIRIPGYTRAPRGRTFQAASWWPLPGDTLVVHFTTVQGNGVIDLRGAYHADTLAGEVWYTSLETGSAFQLGTFTAVKRKRR